jgi:hypothetical protein
LDNGESQPTVLALAAEVAVGLVIGRDAAAVISHDHLELPWEQRNVDLERSVAVSVGVHNDVVAGLADRDLDVIERAGELDHLGESGEHRAYQGDVLSAARQ